MRTLLFASAAFCAASGIVYAQQAPNTTQFTLTTNPAFLKCLSADGKTEPKANVVVKRGSEADFLAILVTGLKPNLEFDLFTVQRSSLDASGTPVANFPGFGLARASVCQR